MPSPVVFWIWLCAYLNCAGWLLSWLHQLNAGGYVAAFAIGLGGLWLWQRTSGGPLLPKIYPPKYRRRFRRAFPMAFLILAVVACIGGATHPANNWDTLAYRTPRVLHWLADNQWHWVYSEFPRLNTRSAGFEWLTAPLMLFTGTDRLVFLINAVCFLLLPGRIFAVLTRLGVRPRAAWHWMWLFPSGYGFVLQAGSVVNDLCGAFMALAAIEFALRARRERNLPSLWTSALAAALMTSVKAFNLVLLLPWAWIVLPVVLLPLRKPLATTLVVLLAAGASLLPTAALNTIQCGDWTGNAVEQSRMGGGHEAVRLCGNLIAQPIANFAPPVFPFKRQWDDFVKRVVPARFAEELQENTEGGIKNFSIPELQVEESAGLGCGVSLLLACLLVTKLRRRDFSVAGLFSLGAVVSLGAWIGVGVIMLRVGYAGPGRYLLPFYLLLAVPILAGGAAAEVFRRPLWRGAAFVIFTVAGMLLVLSPQRPLWPADTILKRLDAEHSHNFLLQRANAVYPAYAVRADGLAPIIAALPSSVTVLGYVGLDQPETSLWRPFGSRRVLHIDRRDTGKFIRSREIKFAAVNVENIERDGKSSIDSWCRQRGAETVAEFSLKNHAGKPAEAWRLVMFR